MWIKLWIAILISLAPKIRILLSWFQTYIFTENVCLCYLVHTQYMFWEQAGDYTGKLGINSLSQVMKKDEIDIAK